MSTAQCHKIDTRDATATRLHSKSLPSCFYESSPVALIIGDDLSLTNYCRMSGYNIAQELSRSLQKRHARRLERGVDP
jgi:hypothetical protein